MSKPSKRPAGESETKALHIEIKAAPEGIIEAYAAAFGNVDSYGDVIERGAFAKTLQERGPQGSKKIRALLNHDGWNNLPVGTPQAMQEDSFGLLTSTKMSATQLGKDIYTLAQEGAISDLSIGYYALKATYPDDEANRAAGIYRTLSEVKLIEYSFLSVPPANESAVIIGVKSAGQLEREIKRWTAIAEVELASKAGRVLSAANAKKILSALTTLQDLVAAAGLDQEEEAADGTSDTGTGSTDAPKSSAEPPMHSPLLTALQQKARALDVEEKKGGLLAELRSFGASLGGN